MQTIEAKLKKITALSRSLGLSDDDARHLIHGTGGSPRRAKKAMRMGIHQQLIDAYVAALAKTGAHTTAVIQCGQLWAELVPAAQADPEDGEDDEGGADEAVAVQAAVAKARKPKKAAADTKTLASLLS